MLDKDVFASLSHLFEKDQPTPEAQAQEPSQPELTGSSQVPQQQTTGMSAPLFTPPPAKVQGMTLPELPKSVTDFSQTQGPLRTMQEQALQAPAPTVPQEEAPGGMEGVGKLAQQIKDKDVKYQKERGFASGLLGDVVGGAFEYGTEMLPKAVRAITPEDSSIHKAAQDVQDWGERQKIEHPFLAPTTPANSVSEAIHGGVRSAAQSLATGLPTAAAAVTAGPLLGAAGLSTAALGLAGYAGGAATQFGAAQYQDVMDRAVPELMKKEGITKEEAEAKARPAALREAGYETGFELMSDVLGGKILGFFGKKGAKGAVSTIKNMLADEFKPKAVAKKVGEVFATETGSEVLTGGFEQAEEKGLGLSNEGFWDGAKQAFGPAGVASLIFAGLGLGGVHLANRSNLKALENAEADPNRRLAAVNQIYDQLSGINQKVADVWGQVATDAVDARLPISADDDLMEMYHKAQVETGAYPMLEAPSGYDPNKALMETPQSYPSSSTGRPPFIGDDRAGQTGIPGPEETQRLGVGGGFTMRGEEDETSKPGPSGTPTTEQQGQKPYDRYTGIRKWKERLEERMDELSPDSPARARLGREVERLNGLLRGAPEIEGRIPRYDKENAQGISGQVREGQKSEQAQSQQGTGGKTAETGGILQGQGQGQPAAGAVDESTVVSPGTGTGTDAGTKGPKISDDLSAALDEAANAVTKINENTDELSGSSTTKEIAEEKAHVKGVLHREIKAGTIPVGSAVRATEIDELQHILKNRKLLVGKSFEGAPGISATEILDANNPVIPMYGDYERIPVAIIAPKEAITGKGQSTNEVLLDPNTDVTKLRFSIDKHDKVYTIDELPDVLKEIAGEKESDKAGSKEESTQRREPGPPIDLSTLSNDQLVALGKDAGYPEDRLKNLHLEHKRKTLVSMLQELENKGLLDKRALDQPKAESKEESKAESEEPKTSRVMDEEATLQNSHTYEGVDYELWKGEKSWIVRIYDRDAEELVGVTKYPNEDQARNAWAKASQIAMGPKNKPKHLEQEEEKKPEPTIREKILERQKDFERHFQSFTEEDGDLGLDKFQAAIDAWIRGTGERPLRVHGTVDGTPLTKKSMVESIPTVLQMRRASNIANETGNPVIVVTKMDAGGVPVARYFVELPRDANPQPATIDYVTIESWFPDWDRRAFPFAKPKESQKPTEKEKETEKPVEEGKDKKDKEDKFVPVDLPLSVAIRDKTLEKAKPFLIEGESDDKLLAMLARYADEAQGEVLVEKMKDDGALTPHETEYINGWDKDNFAQSVLHYVKRKGLLKPVEEGEKRQFKIGDIVRPTKESGLPERVGGRIQHVQIDEDGTRRIKTENTGNRHYLESDWELVTPVEEEQETTPTPAAANLATYGLSIKKTTTAKGNPVWEVSGNTKKWSTYLHAAGGSWYARKMVWSYYQDDDPTQKILEKLPRETTAPSLEVGKIYKVVGQGDKNKYSFHGRFEKENRHSYYFRQPNGAPHQIDKNSFVEAGAPDFNIGTVDNLNPVELAKVFEFYLDEQGLNKVKLQQIVADLLGIRRTELLANESYLHKPIEEAFEYAIVRRARDIIGKEGRGTLGITMGRTEVLYEQLKSLYERQPNLATRTSSSIENQAYSTPVHLAFLVQRFAGVTWDSELYEPTAGTGMLFTVANPKNVTANELQESRVKILEDQKLGAVISSDGKDAVQGKRVGRNQDVVVANPPFGSIPAEQIDGYKIKKLEHAIMMDALKAMKNNGRAAFIIGGHNFDRNGAMTEANRVFLNWLHHHYYVLKNIEIAGDAYGRQGTSFDIRLIVVASRKAEPQGWAPMSMDDPVYGNVKGIDQLLPILKMVEDDYNSFKEITYVTETGGVDTTRVPGELPNQEPSGSTGPEGAPSDGEELPGNLPGEGSGTSQEGTGRPGGRAGTPGNVPSGVGESGTEPVSGGIPGEPPGNRQPLGEGGPPNETVPPGETQGGTGEGSPTGGGRGETPTGSSGTQEGTGRPGSEGVSGTKPKSIEEELAGLDLNALDSLFDEASGKKPETPIPEPTEETKSPEEEPKKPKAETQKIPKEFRRVPISEQGFGDWWASRSKKKPKFVPELSKDEVKSQKDKTLKDLATKFGGEVTQAMSEAFDGLVNLFGAGTNGRLSMGLTFDEGTYRKAKPHFEKAWQYSKDAGNTLVDFLKKLVSVFGENIKPYAIRFLQEKQEELKRTTDDYQAPYAPKSKGTIIDETLIPRKMAEALSEALKALEEKVGDIDNFVLKKLKYKDRDTLWKHLSADQVDAVALAIHNIDQGIGMIVGDQTGVGKGRVAAAMMRYAHINNHKPIFFTEKPNLFSDIYRDIVDIGHDFNPFIMAANATLANITDEDGKLIYKTLDQRERSRILSALRQHGVAALPNHDTILTTYSQVNRTGNSQQWALRSAAPDNFVILDEAHNASGGGSRTGAFIREIITHARGPLYLSATFAKRPDTMALYFKTSMSRANLSMDDLIMAVSRGGIALQEILSNALARLGQYIRREKSFRGISMNVQTDTKNKARDEKRSDAMTAVLRAIVSIDSLKDGFIADINDDIQSGGTTDVFGVDVQGAILDSGELVRSSVTSTNFASVVHNAVRQLLLALKCDVAVEKAIQELEAGRKPVIALSNTMGSFVEDMVSNGLLNVGENFDIDFSNVLEKHLSRTRIATVRHPDGSKDTIEIPLSEFPDAFQEEYQRIRGMIANLTKDVPGSPIDYIRQQLAKRGYRVDEITGRQYVANLSDPDNPKLMHRSASIKSDRKRLLREFNNGQLDVLIVNAAGATGLSIHAAPNFADKRPRSYIGIQPELNVDTEVQKMGRINRKGQVTLPFYTTMMLDTPAEIRPASVLMRKLKSLSANTSANSDSALMQKEIPDMMNKYGDRVTAAWLNANVEVAALLGFDVLHGPVSAVEVSFQQVSGKIAIQPVELQRQFFDEVEERYNDLIEQLKQDGLYDLEVEDLDLDAVTEDSQIMVNGNDESNPFGMSTYMERVSTKPQSRPYTKEKLEELITANLKGKDPDRFSRDLYAEIERKTRAYIQTRLEKVNADRRDEVRGNLEFPLSSLKTQLANEYGEPFFTIGKGYLIDPNGVNRSEAILIDIRHQGETGNPAALSKTRMIFAVPDSRKIYAISMSRLYSPEDSINLQKMGDYMGDMLRERWDTRIPESNIRHRRYIITGNLLQGFAAAPDGSRIVRYTTRDGALKEGILTPIHFSPGVNQRDHVGLTMEQAIRAMENMSNDDALLGSNVTLSQNHMNYIVSVPRSRDSGRRFYTDQDLKDLMTHGEFESRGNSMVARCRKDRQTLERVINRVYELGDSFSIVRSLYNQIFGDAGQTAGQTNDQNSGVRYSIETPETSFKSRSEITIKDIREAFPRAGIFEIKGGWRVRLPSMAVIDILPDQQIIINRAKARETYGYEVGKNDIAIGEWSRLDGGGIIRLAKIADAETLRHEVFHAAMSMALTNLERSQILREFGSEEAAADAYAKWEPAGKDHNLFQKILDFAKKLAEILLMMYPRPSRTFEKIRSGKVWERETRGETRGILPKMEEDPMYSIRPNLDGLDENQKASVERIFSPGKKPLKERINSALSGWHTKVDQGLFDRFASLKALAQESGRTEWEINPYIAARMTTSMGSIFDAVLKHGVPVWNNGAVHVATKDKGIQEIFKPLGDKMDRFLYWKAATRAEKLMAEGREHLFTEEDIRNLKRLRDGNEELFDSVDKEYTEFKKGILDFAQDSGVINEEERAMWDHDEYIPFYRVVEESESRTKGPFNKKGIASQSSGIRTLKGGESQLGDLFVNIMMNFSHLIDASVKNHATNLAIQAALETGAATKANYEFKPVLGTGSSIAKIMKKEYGDLLEFMGIDASLLDTQTLKGLHKVIALHKPKAPNVIHVLKNGKPEYYEIADPLLLRSLTAVSEKPWGGPVMWLMRALRRTLTTGVTSDPAFMAANLARDTVSAWVMDNNFKAGVDSVKGIVKTWREDEDYVALMSAGGSFHGGYGYDLEAAKRTVQRLADKHHIDRNTVLDSAKKVWDFWQKFGSSFENATRVKIYSNVIAKGGGHLEAAYRAKDIMDYSMRGDWALIRFLCETVPFFGARLQGLQRLGRGAMENPKGFALKGAALTVATLGLMALNWDDDRYKELEEWDKDNYYHWWIGDQHFRLPKPFEVGAIFSTIPERMFEAWAGDRGAKLLLDRILFAMNQTLAFQPPQIIGPVIEQYANRSLFTGRPIVGMGLERLQPEAQRDPWTSATASELGKLLNASPKRIEALVRGYTGTIGMYLLGASDAFIRQAWDYPSQPSQSLDDMPVIKRFYQSGPQKNTRYVTDVYDMIKEADNLVATVNHYRKTGEIEKAKGLKEENKAKYLKRSTLSGAEERLQTINKQIKEIHLSKTMDAETKTKRIEALIERRNEIAKRTYEKVSSAFK